MIGRYLRAAWKAIDTLVSGFGLEIAGNIAYTGLLAIFPFLVFLASLAGFIGGYADSFASVRAALDLLPADIARTLQPVIQQILNSADGSLLTLGFLGAIWFASSGFDSLRVALNAAYDVDEPRSWWVRKLRSIGGVVVGGIVFLLLSVLVIFGPLIWKAILWVAPLDESRRWPFALFRYGLATLVLFAALMALHRWLPGRCLTWRTLLPGVIATTILWLLAAWLYSVYLATLGNYGATYGSLGGVIATLVFFYFSAVLFIFGAEFNKALLRQHRTRRAPLAEPQAT
ncbi:MAG TPA: YihY/virulence factor BrkB family protein [Ferrovibrio sp.]|uniref:YihY/virulence factor BrkB family protein n=1 Tax=Ferrovibrio sp. TaxID=1917215 RepID=UPI002ED5BF94